jgi:PEP-CTERM motif
MNYRIIASVAFLSFFISCVTALAQIEVTGKALTTVTDLEANPTVVTDNHTFDNTTIATANTPTTTSSSAAMANGSGNSTVTASEGIFHGFATSTYSNTGNNEYAETDVRSSAIDLGTIVSPTLAANTPVSVNFSIGVSGTITSPDVTAGGAYQAFATSTFTIYQLNGPYSLILTYNSPTGYTNVPTGTFNGFVGERIELSQSMEISTYVSGEYLFTHPDTATVDFSNTIQFFGDPTTPNVSLVADSGHDYSSVPEPATFVLLAIALPGLLLVRRRRSL